MYPDFLSGWCYVTNVPTIEKLIRGAYTSDFFWIGKLAGFLNEHENMIFAKIQSILNHFVPF